MGIIHIHDATFVGLNPKQRFLLNRTARNFRFSDMERQKERVT